MEPALLGEFLCCNGLRRVFCLIVETDEMLYTKMIDIGIIGNALLGEICTQISTVGSDGEGKLLQG